MTTVGISRSVCVVLEQIDIPVHALVVKSLLCLDYKPLKDSLSGPIVSDQVRDVVAFRGGVFRMASNIQVQPRTVGEKHIATSTPGDNATEEVAGYFIGAEPSLPVEGAGDAVLRLQTEDAPVHGITLRLRYRFPAVSQ